LIKQHRNNSGDSFDTGRNENTKRNRLYMVEHKRLAGQQFGAVAACVRAFSRAGSELTVSQNVKSLKPYLRKELRTTRAAAPAQRLDHVCEKVATFAKRSSELEVVLELAKKSSP
jgi:hypothetical protein